MNTRLSIQYLYDTWWLNYNIFCQILVWTLVKNWMEDLFKNLIYKQGYTARIEIRLGEILLLNKLID